MFRKCFSLGGFCRLINAGLNIFAKYEVVRRLLQVTVFPLVNLAGLGTGKVVLEHERPDGWKLLRLSPKVKWAPGHNLAPAPHALIFDGTRSDRFQLGMPKFVDKLKGWGAKAQVRDLRFSRPLVLLQSDDWGRVGVRDREGYEQLRSSGIHLGENPYDYYSLETAEDVMALREC